MSQKFILAAIASCGSILCLSSALAQTPPTVAVSAATASTMPSLNPWAFTISPGAVGGNTGQVITTSDEEVFDVDYGFYYLSWGSVVLLAGHKYTFNLSSALGGGWNSNGGTSYYSVEFYDCYTLGVFTNWIAAASNPGKSNAVTIASLPSDNWSFQVQPQITANIEDNTYSPPVTSYVPSGATVSGGQIPLATDLWVWTFPAGSISYMYSSRGNVDALKPSSGAANSSGAFFTTLTTVQKLPPITVSANLLSAFYQPIIISSPALNTLPAKCRMQFHCTIYYTPKEIGFTSARGFDVTAKTATGTGMQYEHDFVKAVKQEGYGLLQSPVGGMSYLAYNSTTDLFFFASTPVGSHSNPLVPCASCAIAKKTFPSTAHLATEAPIIQAVFGNQQWSVADVGGLDPDQIDLYFGLDLPTPGERSHPTSTTFVNNYGTPAVLASY